MKPSSGRFELILRWIFGSPWAAIASMTLLGTASAWMLLRNDALFAWSRLAVGAVSGAFIGVLFSVETLSSWRAHVKLMICGVVGILVGGVVGILLQLGTVHILVAAMTGFALGVTSRHWMFHVKLP